ncbi:acyl-CoA dehydratase activase [Lutispora saccharofermentans]|uniref:Acyl-CoA dehydratase activase n=1 Tax=Lutispora saccharofermentans TaxID=3024236 RepID=A0ABT1NJ81_9FIRM|nr:acyl-CoA dehydratase activase [Lutispora saccharofermentans]MCQ1531129.1 acyl-CoA dehydratase activase [Lutispora saccharofermentans]
MYLGVDVGSVSTDVVLIDENSTIMKYTIVKSGFDHKAAIESAINKICNSCSIDIADIKRIVGTGYGRRNVPGTCKTITEISCHAMGIHSVFPDVRTVIDIGGQDSKIIRVTHEGFAENFLMNDKCAAGTGRFLEVMAHTIGIDVNDLGEISLKAKKVQSISSICTVFAESEVISRIAEGCKKEEIVAGIHKAIAERITGMAYAIGIKEPIALTGGVAKNKGVVNAITKYLGVKILIPEEPQIIGAIGAAIYAKDFQN